MRIVAVLNQKGGVGKSNVVMNLAAVAADHSRVLVVDTDHLQRTASDWAETAEKNERPLPFDFTDEGERYRHRDALSGLFAEWFAAHPATEVADALSASSVLWERYRTFAEVAADERVTANPLFSRLDQPRIGEYLAPGLPVAVNGDYPPAVAAPTLGDDTADVLAEWLGLGERDVRALNEAGTVR